LPAVNGRAVTTVGLPDSAVRERRERVRTSIRNGGYAFPADRVTVNLAPAGSRGPNPGRALFGPHFDSEFVPLLIGLDYVF